MILILSLESDYSTDEVIEWIKYIDYNSFIVRLDSEKDYFLLFKENDIILKNKSGFDIPFSKITSVWYRRGYMKFKMDSIFFKDINNKERIDLEEYINYELSIKKSINTYDNIKINKLKALLLAKKNSLLTPKWYLIEQKAELNRLIKNEKLITKNFLESSFFSFTDTGAVIYTQDVDQIENVPDSFLPSLIQVKVEKKYEVRIFFFNNQFWSMAILSQQDEQTQTDFRRYNNQFPNRTVSYKLPISEEEKLLKLMKDLDLDCCSIDAIITPKNEFVFLEINPVGQFSMVSIPCNYFIEKEIAKFLITL